MLVDPSSSQSPGFRTVSTVYLEEQMYRATQFKEFVPLSMTYMKLFVIFGSRSGRYLQSREKLCLNVHAYPWTFVGSFARRLRNYLKIRWCIALAF